MLLEVKKLEENAKLDFQNFFLSFGKKITFNLVKQGVEAVANSGAASIRFDYQDTNSEMSKSFKTVNGRSVKDLIGILAVAHRTDEGAVTLLHSVLTTFGYADERGEPGIPAGAPWVYRELTFHGIELPGGLITSAFKSESGEFYEVVQPINFAFHIT